MADSELDLTSTVHLEADLSVVPDGACWIACLQFPQLLDQAIYFTVLGASEEAALAQAAKRMQALKVTVKAIV
jgi:hypothetical protein